MTNYYPIKTAIPTLRAIFEHCNANAVSMKELASLSKASQSTIGRYRNGDNAPSIQAVEDMCAALGLEIVVRPKGEQ